jgi:hypothetical protein
MFSTLAFITFKSSNLLTFDFRTDYVTEVDRNLSTKSLELRLDSDPSVAAGVWMIFLFAVSIYHPSSVYIDIVVSGLCLDVFILGVADVSRHLL